MHGIYLVLPAWFKIQNFTLTIFFVFQEQDMLYQRATEVSGSTFKQPNRYVKLWVKLVTPLIKNFFWDTACLSGSTSYSLYRVG